MQNGCLWVLITDGATARICSTREGMTTTLQVYRSPASDWRYRLDGSDMPGIQSRRGFSGGGKRLFAVSLAQFLQESGQQAAYEKLVIIASPYIAGALNAALTPETRARMIGKIVCDVENCETLEFPMAELLH